jgi:hypothetical protein
MFLKGNIIGSDGNQLLQVFNRQICRIFNGILGWSQPGNLFSGCMDVKFEKIPSLLSS